MALAGKFGGWLEIYPT